MHLFPSFKLSCFISGKTCLKILWDWAFLYNGQFCQGQCFGVLFLCQSWLKITSFAQQGNDWEKKNKSLLKTFWLLLLVLDSGAPFIGMLVFVCFLSQTRVSLAFMDSIGFLDQHCDVYASPKFLLITLILSWLNLYCLWIN